MTHWRVKIEWFLISIGVVLLIDLPQSLGSDGYYRFQQLHTFFSSGNFNPLTYSMVGPLFASPLVWFDSLKGQSGPLSAHYNLILVLLSLIGFYTLFGNRLDKQTKRHFTLIIICASMFAPHMTRNGFGAETFTAICLGIGFLAFAIGKRYLTWLLVPLGLANIPASAIGVLLAISSAVWDSRKLRYCLILVIGVCYIVLESLIERGDFFSTGYEGDAGNKTLLPLSGRPGFTTPFLIGFLSILLSFGKGLLFYAPGLLLPIKKYCDKDLRTTYKYWLLILVGMVLVYSKWWAWYGGWAWGPRFFLFASIPASFAIALNIKNAKSSVHCIAVLLILVLSTWVSINGVAFNQANMEFCSQNNYWFEAICHYTPEFSELWRPLFADFSPSGQRIRASLYMIISAIYLGLLPLGKLSVNIVELWNKSKSTLRELKF